MHNKEPEDHSKDTAIPKAVLRNLALVAVIAVLALVLLGLLLGFPWQLILGITLPVPFLIVPAILGYKHGRKMYK